MRRLLEVIRLWWAMRQVEAMEPQPPHRYCLVEDCTCCGYTDCDVCEHRGFDQGIRSPSTSARIAELRGR